MSQQTTTQEVKEAFNNALSSSSLGIPGAHAESLVKLRDVRNGKTTWVFEEENELRFMVDAYLREHSA